CDIADRSIGSATELSPDGPQKPAPHASENDGRRPHQQRDARAVDNPAQDVPTQVVGSKPTGARLAAHPGGRLQTGFKPLLLRIKRGKEWSRQAGDNQKNETPTAQEDLQIAQSDHYSL